MTGLGRMTRIVHCLWTRASPDSCHSRHWSDSAVPAVRGPLGTVATRHTLEADGRRQENRPWSGHEVVRARAVRVAGGVEPCAADVHHLKGELVTAAVPGESGVEQIRRRRREPLVTGIGEEAATDVATAHRERE